MSLIEVDFKGHRKGIYTNPQEFPLKREEWVVVRADRGEDLGRVSLIGTDWEERLTTELGEEEPEPILRRANDADLQLRSENKQKEKEARDFFLDAVKRHELIMKLVDAEYQLDCKKLTFYFTADGRVDFRSLVKELAQHFKTRIDLRQIGARDESKRLGGIGICGRELCCESWIRTFDPVTTNMVKEQGLLLNPQKNTGLCGRLRCCLRYEVEQYRMVNQVLPKADTKVQSPHRRGYIEKIDMCKCAACIRWEDGKASQFSPEQLRELSDWDPEKSEPKAPLKLKDDPDYTSSVLVATSGPDTDVEARGEKLKTGPAKPGSQKAVVQRASKPVSNGQRKPASKPGKPAMEKGHRPPPSTPVVLVEAVPISKPSEMVKPDKPASKPAEKGHPKHRSSAHNKPPRRARAEKPTDAKPTEDGSQPVQRRKQRAMKPRPASAPAGRKKLSGRSSHGPKRSTAPKKNKGEKKE